jgi:uncharacterized protein YyaL (SSP411 family)
MKINKNYRNYLILGLFVITFLAVFVWANYQPWPDFIPLSLVKNQEAKLLDSSLPDQDQQATSDELEMIDDVVIIRELDKALIEEKIEQGKEFLYRMERPKEHGFYKRYEAERDYLGESLYTVYSGSIIYTFLYIYDYDQDKKILNKLDDWAEFLLFMQDKDPESQSYGAFSYSYDWYQKEKQPRFVIGTAALNIFPLLRLYNILGDGKYLESAKLSGDWLLTMQNPDGTMNPYLRYEDGNTLFGQKESLLYQGQTLSALSKLYNATKIQKYYNAAEKIAQHFAQKYEDAGRQYIAGEYRTKNPISNSWVVMSLMDFYKINQDDYYKDIVFELSSQVITNQFKDPKDILNYGRIGGAYSTSGNGWMSEVMTDTYKFCLEERRFDCEKYKETVINIIRWIVQYTYSEDNSSALANPAKALGGVYWNKENKYVRTDSVCHALNGYTRIIEHLDDGILVSIPKGF